MDCIISSTKEEASLALSSVKNNNIFQNPPIHRHLQTIGIGPVFLSPPPSETLYAVCTPDEKANNNNNDDGMERDIISSISDSTITDNNNNNNCNDFPKIISSWEIVGSIKKFPEDFEVREIGGFPLKQNDDTAATKEDCKDDKWKLATLSKGLITPTHNSDTKQGRQEQQHEQNIILSPPDSKVDNNVATVTSPMPESQLSKSDHESCGENEKTNSVEKPPMEPSQQDNRIIINVSTPAEAIEKILSNCQSKIISSDALDSNLDTQSRDIGNIGISTKSNIYNEATYKTLQEMNDKACHYMESFDIPMPEEKHSVDTSVSIGHHNSNEDNETKLGDFSTSKFDHPAIDINECSILWIPPLIDDTLIQINTDETPSNPLHKHNQRIEQNKNNAFNRVTFHKSLKLVFPMLKSETVTFEEGQKYLNRMVLAGDRTKTTEVLCNTQSLLIVDTLGNPIDERKNRWIKIKIDTTFFDLKKYLAFPSKDLLSLYNFRNKGCSGFTNTHNNGKGRRHLRHNHKKKINNACDEDAGKTVENDGIVSLRLLPDLPREQRREIHHLFAERSRELETGTRNDVPLFHEKDGEVGSKSLTTTVITVRWSQQAQRMAARKRKGNQINDNSDSNGKKARGGNDNSNKPHTLCVLQKRNIEHLSAINHLVKALNCRQSDIGLAGMKDMRAVTYQFCTLRNVGHRRAQRANSFLSNKSMELGSFERVNWLLNLGDLYGNEFSIIIHNLRRVQIRRQYAKIEDKSELDKSAILEEECFSPCEASHIDAMVERVRNFGFINYYGQQRVGDAGESSDVGIRSFDIGRAMLQQKFGKAIELLMLGRSKCSDDSMIASSNERVVRKVWIESGGDVDKTLKVFPRGNSMMRERTVLKGLKRYGTDNPLSAIRCLHHGARMFWINAYQSYVWNIVATERILRLGTRVVVGDLYMDTTTDDGNNKVQLVEADTLNVNFSQIVLPLPGYNIIYPKNEIGKIYDQILKRDSVDFSKNKSIPEATAKGSYRNLIIHPKKLNWERVKVDDDDSNKSIHYAEAAKFTFSLPSGSYATMLLRELMVNTLER